MKQFSIIIPVRNGGDYLKQAIQSVLAQTYPHLNLLIVESGSTDGSIEYIQSIKDERVILYSTNASFGIEANWARILNIPKNEYMTILGQDDILLPDYLEVMTSLIKQYPEASLYQTHFNQINARGEVIRPSKKMEALQTTPVFLTVILENKIDFMASGFMMRSKDYEAVGGIPDYPNLLFADVQLFLELTQKGFLAVSPANCFSFRIHQSTTAISADIKFQSAFQQFIGYLQKLANINATYQKVISEHGASFIQFYCKGLAHRLIRTPKKLRPNVTVSSLINQCRKYGSQLKVEENFNPAKNKSIKIAKWIDRFAVSRYLFLLYKKIYSKPVL